MKNHTTRILLVLLALMAFVDTAAAQSTVFDAEKGATPKLIKLTFLDGPVFLRSSTEWSTGIYVEHVEGGGRKRLALKPVTTVPEPITSTSIAEPGAAIKDPQLIGSSFLQRIVLELVDDMPSSGALVVHLPGGVFARHVQGRFVPIGPASADVTTTADGSVSNVGELTTALDQTRTDQRLTIQGGDREGVVDFRWARHLVGIGSGILDFQASAQGSLAFDEAKRFDYFNDLEGSIDGYRTFRYSMFGANTYGESGLHYTFDSDQRLGNADHVVGLKFATVLRDPLTGFLNDLLVPEPQAGGHPLWVLRADYVKEALSDSDGGSDAKPDTSDGDVRATANVDWSVPVGRGMGWDFVPQLGTIEKIDFDVAYETTWDFDASEYLDNLKLSLRFGTSGTAGGTATAFDITWVKGQEGPIFHDVEAFLVGITLSR